MRSFLKWLAIILCGVALGAGFGAWQLRARGVGDDLRVGQWSTGSAIGTPGADMRTRAVVAIYGLLALPASEARYFTTRTDSDGQRLDGRCRYTIEGGAIEARWWSITRYDPQGWLIANRWDRHSVGSAAVQPASRAVTASAWTVDLSPTPPPDLARQRLWIATATDGPFDLTLRAYRPRGMLASDPSRLTTLPRVVKQECGA